MGVINIKIKTRDLFLIFGAAVLLTSLGIVFATWDTTKKMFHSAEDVKVTISGTDYSLQQAITDGLIGGGSLSCTISLCNGVNGCTVTCPAGYVVTGGGPNYPSTQPTLDASSIPTGTNKWSCWWGLREYHDCYAVCCKIA